jgi:hypothetical protein
MKNCGGCKHWIKVKSPRSGETYGICDKLDCRCLSDQGHKCQHFKRGPKPKTKQPE